MKTAGKLFTWLTSAACLLVLAVAATFWAFNQIESSVRERTLGNIEVKSASDLLTNLSEAESSQRGFVLTGNESALEPFLAAQSSIEDHLKVLRKMAVNNESQKHLDAMAPMVVAKFSEMTRVIDLRRKQGLSGAMAAIESGQNKRLTDSLQVELHGFLQLYVNEMSNHAKAKGFNVFNQI